MEKQISIKIDEEKYYELKAKAVALKMSMKQMMLESVDFFCHYKEVK